MSITNAWFGPYTVASTNLSLSPEWEYADPEEKHDSLTGRKSYLFDSLLHSSSSFHFKIQVPSFEHLFPLSQGQTMDYCGVVYFPINKPEASTSYDIHPHGFKLPNMLGPEESPAPIDERCPLIIFSHGYQSEFMVHSTLIRILVSHGFMVAAIFHGDMRFGEDDITGRDESSPVRMERLLLRSLSLRTALDTLEKGSFSDHIDWQRVGGLGISFGGSSLMLLDGAPLNITEIDKGIFRDERLQCTAAQVPYMGSDNFQLWRSQSEDWTELTVPWLAVSGSADSIAPIKQVADSMTRMAGISYLVSLKGEEHFMSAKALRVADSWILEFFKRFLIQHKESSEIFQSEETVESDVENTLEIYNA